jgi:hypothetical protein
MTAYSPRSDAESASSTIDPDAQAKRANDGELSSGFQSDPTIDEDAADALLTGEELVAEIDENLDDGTWHAEYCRLAAEQAALRRLATRVARGVESLEVFARWPTRYADACLRTPPDCGASRRMARLSSWPLLPILRRWRDGRWAPELRWKATLSLRWYYAPAGRPARTDGQL